VWIGSIVVVFVVVCVVGLAKVTSQLALADLIATTYRRMVAAQSALGVAFYAGYATDIDVDIVSALLTSHTDSLEELHNAVLRELDTYGDHYPEIVAQHYSSSCLRLLPDECEDLDAGIGPFASFRADVTKGLHVLILEYVAALRAFTAASQAEFGIGMESDFLERIVGLQFFDGSGGLLGSQKILRTYLTAKIATDQVFLAIGGLVEALCVLAMFFGFFTSAAARVRAQRDQMTLLLSTIPASVLAAVPELQQEVYGVGGGLDDTGDF
jgi:hypothetical protein